MPNLFVILGPTSTGKTSLALKLCRKFNGQIVSADSRQIVKYMDIGTGKIPVNSNSTLEDSKKIISGYDLIRPDQYFSAYDYALFATSKINDLWSVGKNIFLVGGTGFYIDIVANRAATSLVEPDLDLRKELELLSLEELQARAKKLKVSDIKNKARLIRALEIDLSKSGKHKAPVPKLRCNYIFIGLTSNRHTLYSRADSWLEDIWTAGLVEETKKLIQMGYANSPKVQGLVYKSALGFIQGTLGEKEAKERAKFDLHAYIRRQQTWFKRNKEINWFNISIAGYEDRIAELVSRSL